MKRLLARGLAACVVAALLAGCATRRQPAPVVDRRPAPAPTASAPVAAPAAAPATPTATAIPDTYTVKRGDTLYAIALDHGLDHRELAEWNGISNPGLIRIDQVLRLKAPDGVAQSRPITGTGGPEARPLDTAEGAPAPTTSPTPAAPAQRPAEALLKTEPKPQRLPYSEENLALLTRPEAGSVKPGAASPPATAQAPSATAQAPSAAAQAPSSGTPQPPAAQTKPPAQEAKPAAQPQQQAQQGDDDKVEWGWPASGRVIAGFVDPSNKGIDISGKAGDPVLASAGGRVMYVGAGIRGYGNLVIIKHNATFLSAYAHNRAILVKEGQNVTKGQKIAEIGNSDSDQPKLHFEIRRQGKPVDPGKFLPDR
jgi:lipoprotein NlpD